MSSADSTSPPSPPPSETRDELLAVATRLFGERGYASTSLEALVSAAGVTKGALYHHFTGKKDLFAAVFENYEVAIMAENARRGTGTPLSERRLDGLRFYLEVAREPRYAQIVLRDAPSVLGSSAQEPTNRPGFPALKGLVRHLVEPRHALDDATLTSLTRMLFSAVLTAASAVSDSEDPAAEVVASERALELLLDSLAA